MDSDSNGSLSEQQIPPTPGSFVLAIRRPQHRKPNQPRTDGHADDTATEEVRIDRITGTTRRSTAHARLRVARGTLQYAVVGCARTSNKQHRTDRQHESSAAHRHAAQDIELAEDTDAIE